jgi:hypothetical protein
MVQASHGVAVVVLATLLSVATVYQLSARGGQSDPDDRLGMQVVTTARPSSLGASLNLAMVQHGLRGVEVAGGDGGVGLRGDSPSSHLLRGPVAAVGTGRGPPGRVLRVSCVGDSITAGSCSATGEQCTVSS